MITNVRIGNDIKLIWQILKGGQPVDLTGATDVKVSVFQGGNSSCDNVYIDTFKITDAVNGILSVEIPKEVITEVGYMWTVLEYTLHDDDMIDGDRKVTVDNVPVRIVSLTAEASQVYEFNISSDILAGFHGKSAFEVWLTQNPDKTEEDYFNWLRQPATDIAETVGLQEQARVEAEELRVLAEQDRQTNTQIAITNAENATENANTAAQNANDARETIQDDLALKANHGYDSSPKTLKEVDDEKADHGYDSAPKTLKAVDEAKVDKSSIVGETGQGETSVMSQKAVTDELSTKASHGYESNPKTLKQVDDEIADVESDVKVSVEKPTAQSLSELNARITALEAIISNKIKDRVDVTKEFNVWGKTNLILYGNGASTKAPDFIGQTYIDTTNGNVYIAVGVSNAGNWKLV